MITKLTFSNFYSFTDEQEISFEVGKKPPHSYYDIDLDTGFRLNKVLVAVGANGAGKTHLLRPFAFLSSFVSDSAFDKPSNRMALKQHLLWQNSPSDFELEFVLDGEKYKYCLRANKKHVQLEALYKKSSRNYSYVFIRERLLDNSGYSYKQKGFGFPPTQAEKVRDNVSIISAAFQQNVSEASSVIAEYFGRFTFNLTMDGKRHYQEGDLIAACEGIEEDEQLKVRLHQAVYDFDLGISDIAYVEQSVTHKDGEEVKFKMPFASHMSLTGEKFVLPFHLESSGTKALFVMLRQLLPVLQYGGVAVMDEIDNDLHPHVLPVILDWFKHEETNPHNAQLIFTCHTPEILNLLKKHQIYLVEKHDLESEAWRLDEMVGLRADDNLYAKYQAGALGAVPNI